MGDVINLTQNELKNCGYYEVDSRHIGLSMKDESLKILPLNLREIEVVMGGESKIYSRSEISEFLKVAGVLVDSFDRYMPGFDLVGLDYPGPPK